jgi:hypothetical protein
MTNPKGGKVINTRGGHGRRAGKRRSKRGQTGSAAVDAVTQACCRVNLWVCLRPLRLRSLVVEHLLRKQKVSGSIPDGGLFFIFRFSFSADCCVIFRYNLQYTAVNLAAVVFLRIVEALQFTAACSHGYRQLWSQGHQNPAVSQVIQIS